jgi:hypothetical protein
MDQLPYQSDLLAVQVGQGKMVVMVVMLARRLALERMPHQFHRIRQ